MANDLSHSNKTKRGRSHGLKEKWNQTSLPNKLLIIFTAVIATANLVYAGLSLWQLSILQGQLNYIQKTSQLEQRAWVGVEIVNIKAIEEGNIISCQIVFRNTGHTPAINVKQLSYMALNMEDSAIIAFFEKDNLDPASSQSPLAPNARFQTTTISKEIMSESIIRAIESRNIRLFLLTKIEYYDIFGTLHKTYASFRYDPKMKAMQAYYKYNYMD